MTQPIWHAGVLIESEKLSQKLLQDSKKWTHRLCIALGNTLPKDLDAVTSAEKVKKSVQATIKLLNENYEKVRDGLALQQKKTSFYSTVQMKELQFLEMKQAVQAQQLPWIKLALLKVSDTTTKIEEQVASHLNLCVTTVHTLLETCEEVSVSKRQLASLKSFLASQLCLFQRDDENTKTLTWDQALEEWVSKKNISQTVIGERVKQLLEKLQTISCLDDPPEEHLRVTFDNCHNPNKEATYTSFRAFLAEQSVQFICDLLQIPQKSCEFLAPIFEDHENIRSLTIFYCDTLDQLKTDCTPQADKFCQSVEQHCSILHTHFTKEFFSIIKTKIEDIDVSEQLKDKLPQRTSRISAYQIQVAPHFGTKLEGEALKLLPLINNFTQLEKFFDCAELVCALNMSGDQPIRVPNWHPFDILFASTLETLSSLKNTISISKGIVEAILHLYNTELKYNFAIENDQRLITAIRYQQRKALGLDFPTAYSTYTEFSKNFSKKSQLDRLKLLLDCSIPASPALLEYVNDRTSISTTETEYVLAIKNAIAHKYFINAVNEIIKQLNIAPTFDEFILVYTYGTRKDLLLHNYGCFTPGTTKIIQKLEKYNFSNFQKILISLEYLSIKASPTIRSDKLIGDTPAPADMDQHIELLFSIEEYLRLSLPQDIAFSWLVYHEMPAQPTKTMITDLKKIRNLASLNEESITTLNEILFTRFGGQTTTRKLPSAELEYKAVLMHFCFRTIYNSPLSESDRDTPPFFFPKTLPFPSYELTEVFSSATLDKSYLGHNQAFFSSWNISEDGFYDYCLFMTKNPLQLETYSSSFRLNIPKQKLMKYSVDRGLMHAFLGHMLSFFVSDMSLMSIYEGDTLTKEQTEKACNLAINFIKCSHKIAHDKVLKAALDEYPRECFDELKAIFLFAYELHHFARKNFVKFSRLPEPDKENKSFLQLASLGTVYDEKEELSLLDPALKDNFPQFKACFSIGKNVLQLSLNDSKIRRETFVFENGRSVKKDIVYELEIPKFEIKEKTLNVTISIENSSISLRMSYPISDFFSEKMLNQLIAWQTLLLKSKFYKSLSSVEDVTKQVKKLTLKDDD